MKKVIVTICILILNSCLSWGQYVLKNVEDVNWYSNIPQEELFINQNATTLLAGEQLQFTTHCFNALTKIYSKNSKVAYVELIGQDKIIFKQKIKLDNGIGQGDFFIPVDITTGNYKLIGYTQWMKNGQAGHYFESDLLIINPYEPIEFNEDAALIQNDLSETSSEWIALEMDSKEYGERSRVKLTIKSLKMSLAYGNFALSVRKVDELSAYYKNDIYDLNKSKFSKTNANRTKTVGETIFLPEFNGEMITGTVLNKSTNSLVAGKKVVLSILSKEAFQDVSTTNEKGQFFFQIKDYFSNSNALFQVLGEDRENYKIKLNDHQSIEYAEFKFDDVNLNPKNELNIIERSIQNQIQMAYDFSENHKRVQPDLPEAFFGNPKLNFKLDDYKRFPTVAQTLVEVVDQAWHERRAGKKRYIKVRERLNSPYFGDNLLPLVVVDGAFIQDHEPILNYDAKLVEEIDVYRDEYYYGKDVYQGIVSIKTKNADYYESMTGDYLEVKKLFRPNLKTQYYSPNHEAEAEARIPDERFQLYWEPVLSLEQQQKEIEFYSSDVKGIFEISLKGFTNSGQPITITKYFEVK
ncbi:MAG: hypothetical protein KJO77_01570 [Bacteroidia bacterium]|nr:hypothetical protein [Bacteroidia bacterium]NND51402.1 hypothetical protein [Flavobacteriaceae bacterium]